MDAITGDNSSPGLQMAAFSSIVIGQGGKRS